MKKIIRKIIASEIVMVMLLAYASTIGIYAKKVYAAENELEVQGVKTNNENVEFDAYFVSQNSKTHETESKIGEENSINIGIAVKNAGYLKNAKIEFGANEKNKTANFKLQDLAQENKAVAKLNKEENSIELNQINKDKQVSVQIPISFDNKDTITLNQFSQENIAKLTGTYIDAKGKEKQIKAQIKVKLDWTQETTLALEEQITRYIPYTVANNQGVMLQTQIKSSIANNAMPVKEENIEIIAPVIANQKPTSVKIVAESTKATNGDETAQNFNEENYQYDEQTGKITIKVENKIDEQGNISWSKNAEDKFIMTYIYPQEILNNVPEEGNKIQIQTKAQITTYGAKENIIENEAKGEILLKDQIGNVINTEVNTNIETLSKGYIYANYEATEKNETQYEENITANIGLVDIVDSIAINLNTDNFVIDEKTKGTATQYIKKISVEKEEFDKFLGEDGFINIKVGNTIIDTINKEKYEVDISNIEASEIAMETSKPLTEGEIKVKATKAIKTDIKYSKKQMEKFTSLEINTTVDAIYAGQIVEQKTANKVVAFVEPSSETELVINNQNLSTVVTNENVEMKAILKTNSLDCKLYKNPTIQIKLPSYIESINVKNIQVLFDKELTVKNANLIQNADGTKTIALELQGTQTQYNLENLAGGTNVVITTDITVNKLTPNIDSEISMVVTNENDENSEINEVTNKISFSAPVGIVTMNGISNYKDGAEELTSITGEEKVAELPILSSQKEATFKMSVMNNYKNDIENVSILGRTPFAGNKEILSNKDLNSTMDFDLTTGINVQGIDSDKVQVYYSENGEATKDLNVQSNGWVAEPSNLSKIKSYLIVTNDYVMQTGEAITFNYNANVAEGLEHNQSSFETYAVYYSNNLEEGTVEDRQETAKVGATTGQGPVLETQITSNAEESILSGDIVKYTVTIKNKGDIELKNVNITIPIDEKAIRAVNMINEDKNEYNIQYGTTELKETINIIPVGESVDRYFFIVPERLEDEDKYCKIESHFKETVYKDENDVEYKNRTHDSEILDDTSTYENEISIFARISAEELEKEIETNRVTNKIKNSHFSIEHQVNKTKLREKDELEYVVNIYNYYNVQEEKIEINLPKEIEYEKITLEEIKINNSTNSTERNVQEIDKSKIVYDNSTEKLQIPISGDKDTRMIIYLNAKVKETKEEKYSKKVSISSDVLSNDNKKESTKEIGVILTKNILKIIQAPSIPEEEKIENGQELIYKILIESVGNESEDIVNIDFEDYLPQEVILKGVTRKTEMGESEIYGTDLSENNKLELSTQIQEGKSEEINIYVKAISQKEDTKITNKITATIDEKEIEINSISHTLKATEITDNDNPNVSENKRISGQVWLDENKDGQKDEQEKKMQNIEVMLLNNGTGNLEKEKISTSEDGKYTFTEVPKGKYTVIFLYDTANYSSTTYRKQGVDSTLNSDAIDTQIILGEEKRTAAITEEIEVTNSNIYNIDLGLVVNPKFDLKLDKTVSKMTVQDSTGTKTYDYKDTKLAKRDLVGKQINSTTIVIEYKIKVTNEGAVSGYAKKIADYIPAELKFNSELNKDWYQGENGAIYSSSLANTLINPGETKEITLLLTKKLTQENVGLINNTAEIQEAYNDLGLQDVDSTPANKVSGEDDMSSADVLLTVKTGETILFIVLSLGIISAITASAYVIKRKILG